MKKLRIFSSILLFALVSSAFSEETKTIINPLSGRPDYITKLSTSSIKAGSGVTVTTTTAGVEISASSSGGFEIYPATSTKTPITAPGGFAGSSVTLTIQPSAFSGNTPTLTTSLSNSTFVGYSQLSYYDDNAGGTGNGFGISVLDNGSHAGRLKLSPAQATTFELVIQPDPPNPEITFLRSDLTTLYADVPVAFTNPTVTVDGKDICLDDGTNCPSASAGSSVYPATAAATFPFEMTVSTIVFANGTTQFSGVYGSTVDACMMHLESADNFFNKGTETIIPYDTVDFEHGCTASVASSSITINTAGTYTVVAQGGNRTSSANTQITTAIYVNGTKTSSCLDQANSVAFSVLRCVAVLDLNVSDRISAYFLMTGTGSQQFSESSLSTGAGCMLAVVRNR